MEVKKFKMIDEGFICDVCGQMVRPLGYTARDHCPNCLSSKHVDINPGDRLCSCNGILKPIGIYKFKNIYKIKYKCLKCGMEKNNIMANDDNMEKVISLSVIE